MTRNNANNKHLGIGPRIRERSKIRVPNSAEFGRIRIRVLSASGNSRIDFEFPNSAEFGIRVPNSGELGQYLESVK